MFFLAHSERSIPLNFISSLRYEDNLNPLVSFLFYVPAKFLKISSVPSYFSVTPTGRIYLHRPRGSLIRGHQ